MKGYFYFFLLWLLCAACTKDNKQHFTVLATNPGGQPALLEVQRKTYPFSGTELRKDISVAAHEVLPVMIYAQSSLPVRLQLLRGAEVLGEVRGIGYVYAQITPAGLVHSTLPSGTGSGGAGFDSTAKNCSAVQCAALTQSGSRCTRMTNNCNGRCWQHQ